MIPIKRLGHFVLRVANVERSKRFYTELLGMHVLEQDPAHGGVFLGLGQWGNTLDLIQSSDPSAGSSHADISHVAGVGFHHAAFAVETQEALREGYFTLQDHSVPTWRHSSTIASKASTSAILMETFLRFIGSDPTQSQASERDVSIATRP